MHLSQDDVRREPTCRETMRRHLRLAPTPARDGRIREPHPPILVVVVGERVSLRQSIRLLLDAEHDIQVVAEASDLPIRRHMDADDPHVLVLDLHARAGPAAEVVAQFRVRVPETEIVVLTMDIGSVMACCVLTAGALGYVLTERADTDLPIAVRSAAGGEMYVSPPVRARLDALGGQGPLR
jgi:DNA-binding NarL/FixJ family response regulator